MPENAKTSLLELTFAFIWHTDNEKKPGCIDSVPQKFHSMCLKLVSRIFIALSICQSTKTDILIEVKTTGNLSSVR